LRRRRAPEAPTRLDADLPCGGGGRFDASFVRCFLSSPREDRPVGSSPAITLFPRRGARFA